MTKRTQALQFDTKTKYEVWKRDHGSCIFCRINYHMQCTDVFELGVMDIMHFIPKSSGGMGIEKNGAVGCRYHHHLLDNGSQGLRMEMLAIFENHLRDHYKNWNSDDLLYKKYGGLFDESSTK